MMTRTLLVFASLLMSGAASAQNLKMGLGGQITSLDPHYHSASPNAAFSYTIFDRLTGTDENARLQPALATSWKMIDPLTWEFKLREGVKFHNGEDFTAEDVVFTFERIPKVTNSPGPYTSYLRGIERTEIVDPLTLRIRTSEPVPTLPLMLQRITILDSKTHANVTTEDFNSGKALIGTGPFKYVSGSSISGVKLARNDQHWGEKAAWETVDYRVVANNAARTAALLSGDVDMIDQVSSADVPRLSTNNAFEVVNATGLRLMYINLDHSRKENPVFITDASGKPLAKNPLTDVRVRQALSLAIDRKALAERVMDGLAVPSMQFMPPDTYGYAADIAAPAADPAKARALLAEAGYPQGFQITLHGSNDRFPNDARVLQAIGQMWTRIGVKTNVDAMPYGPFQSRASKQEFAAFLGTWGSAGEPGIGMTNTLATFDKEKGTGSINRGRYSNPAYDVALAAAVSEIDDTKREQAFQQVMRDVLNDMPILPLYIQKNTWALKKSIAFKGRADELTLPQEAKPSP
ncbi:ABC transporter substrate-binding protein [Microvirga pudoricolor]|uniref:ABC transporter substrate-binding protein n=1 Tax=Microvirga pudoricolor TaxID=2778729 RepID=UPI00194EE659|nr:ABC transporter substrate-binding protein [Microvirga pudoricolor]MBM6593563.1 ABC transporter substrate-binding protein [Microvirga pudoricolor]